MKFNVNDKVRVKLTDHGRKVLREAHAVFWADYPNAAPREYTPQKEDAEGWSEWQLHALMDAFGSRMLGGPLLFETTIELVLPDQTPVAQGSTALDVNDAIEARQKLERDILALLSEFAAKTSLTVRGVQLDLMDMQYVGLNSVSRATGVRVEVRL